MWYEDYLIKRAMRAIRTRSGSATVPMLAGLGLVGAGGGILGGSAGAQTAAMTSDEKEFNKAKIKDILMGTLAGAGLGAVGTLAGGVAGMGGGIGLAKLLSPARNLKTKAGRLGQQGDRYRGTMFGLSGGALGGLVGAGAGGYAGGRLATRNTEE